ncbi:MAG: hemolysin family protein [candidate division WOR-3 bacterium]
MFWQIPAIVVLLVLSFIFSGAEAAFFSLPQWRVREHRQLSRLIAEPGRLLGTLLFSNLLVNISATAIFTLLLLQFSSRFRLAPVIVLTAGGILMTAILLLFGEITPKLLATRYPDTFARIFPPFIAAVQYLIFPVTWLLNRISAFARRLPEETTQLSEPELQTMITFGREQGVLLPGEEEILRNLIQLDRRTVSEVMTPRQDMVAVPEEATIAAALDVCRQSGFSRLPVYSGTLEKITGVVYAKELLTAPDPKMPVVNITRPPYFVPEVKRLAPLLDELRRKNSHIAIVIDEFGQTAGMVTLEDILEAIFGEIRDEFDRAEELPYRRVGENEYIVDGEIDLVTLNRLFDDAFTGFEFDRLATLIYDRLGRLAKTGDTVRIGNLEITVTELSQHRLEKVFIRKLER